MTKNLFLASCAKAAFALATVVMMSAAFTACSSSNDDPTTEPLPEPKAGTVTIDGTEKSIVKAEYKDKADGNYALYLYLSADGKERVNIQLNKDLHMTGHAFNLTKREEEHSGKWYWSVEYYKPDDTKLIDTYGRSGYSIPVFTTGTLTISGSPDGTINIRLENGRVEGTDGKEHTIVLSYSGTMTKYVKPEPKVNTVTLDGAEKPILKAEYEDCGDGNYFLFLYLSADSKEKIELNLNKDLHMTGSPIDLTKREKKHEGDEWYWVADYHNSDESLFTNITGNPDSNGYLYTTGTLTVTGDPKSGKVSIKLENGRVEANDDKEHTLTVSYSGTMTEGE